MNQRWSTHQLQVGNLVPRVISRVIVDTTPRSDADPASGTDRRQLRESESNMFQIGFIQPFTDGDPQNISSTHSSETQTKTGFNNTAQKTLRGMLLDMSCTREAAGVKSKCVKSKIERLKTTQLLVNSTPHMQCASYLSALIVSPKNHRIAMTIQIPHYI